MGGMATMTVVYIHTNTQPWNWAGRPAVAYAGRIHRPEFVEISMSADRPPPMAKTLRFPGAPHDHYHFGEGGTHSSRLAHGFEFRRLALDATPCSLVHDERVERWVGR